MDGPVRGGVDDGLVAAQGLQLPLQLRLPRLQVLQSVWERLQPPATAPLPLPPLGGGAGAGRPAPVPFASLRHHCRPP